MHTSNVHKKQLSVENKPLGSRKRNLAQFKAQNPDLQSPKDEKRKEKARLCSVQKGLQLPSFNEFKAPFPKLVKLAVSIQPTKEEVKQQQERLELQKAVIRLSAIGEPAEEEPKPSRRSQSVVLSSLRQPERRDKAFFHRSRGKPLSNSRSQGSLAHIEEDSEPNSELSQISLEVRQAQSIQGEASAEEDLSLSIMLSEMDNLKQKLPFEMPTQPFSSQLFVKSNEVFAGRSPLQYTEDQLDEAFDQELDQEESEPSAGFLEQESLQARFSSIESQPSAIKEQHEEQSHSDIRFCVQVLDQSIEASLLNRAFF